MRNPRRLVLAAVVLFAGCGGTDPSGPGTGALALAVTGLPAGVAAAVTVTGPGGYAHQANASETLASLAPGSYTIEAEPVDGNGRSYRPAESTQTVSVVEGSTPASAQVVYGTIGAELTITISGLPPATAAAVTVSGPDGFERSVAATTTLSELPPGLYTVASQSVSSLGSRYDPSPATQTVSLAEGTAGSATVSYAEAPSSGLNLRIDGLYLTQSVQTYAGAVPLVRNRPGFLRVFVTASGANLATPAVRIRFFVAGIPVKDTILAASGLTVPRSPDEGSLAASWNMPVPGSLIQPGLAVLAEVDPDNAVAESDETDNQFPATGVPLVLEVRTVPTFALRFVPVLQTANGLQGDVTNANKDGYLAAAMRMHPLAGIDADLRAPLSTDAPAVQSGSTSAWTQILNEVNAARVADQSAGSRYYYGVVKPAYTSGIAGIGFVGVPAALGWDRPGADFVAAHEWGHNWGRQHAPCGGAANPDTNYPYANGAIGVYGFDITDGSLKPPNLPDLMGYCNNEWISDYTYSGVLNFRGAQASLQPAFEQAVQRCLLVWGRIVDGRAVLEPAFEVLTRPSLPSAPGPASVEGLAADGSRLFRVSFTPDRVADDPAGGEQFAFAVPLAPDRAARLESLRLALPGRPAAVVRAGAGVAADRVGVRATRRGARVALEWDAAAHPMLLVRDPASGQVLAFARGGRSEVVTDRVELDVRLSSDLGRRSVRVAVPAR